MYAPAFDGAVWLDIHTNKYMWQLYSETLSSIPNTTKSIYPCALPNVVKLKRYFFCLLTILSAEYRRKDCSDLGTLANEVQIVKQNKLSLYLIMIYNTIIQPVVIFVVKPDIYRESNSNSHVLGKEKFYKGCMALYV
jgi:hypothetical protein